VRVYALRADLDAYTAFVPVPETDIHAFFLDGRPRRDSWRPIELAVIDDEFPGLTEVGDLSTVGTTPLLSRRAVRALKSLLTGAGELLPVRTAGGAYFAYNVTCVAPALDREQTEAEWFDSERIMADHRLAFKAEVVEGLTFFRVPELLSRQFMTEEVARRVSKAQLTGFDLCPIWGPDD
jgi:hypothetical protein